MKELRETLKRFKFTVIDTDEDELWQGCADDRNFTVYVRITNDDITLAKMPLDHEVPAVTVHYNRYDPTCLLIIERWACH